MKRREKTLEQKEDKRKLKELSKLTRERAAEKCEWCGFSGKYLNCHHIISRKFKPLKYSLDNSILLCASCHKFAVLSAHNNPIKMIVWLVENRLESLKVLMKAVLEGG